MNEFLKQKTKQQTKKAWDLFYKRNTTNFFKDRHWIVGEFIDLQTLTEQKSLLEVGCGVGNLVLPLQELDLPLVISCCDFSPVAIQLLQEKSKSVNSFVCDFTYTTIPIELQDSSFDFITLIFMLSAIEFDKQQQVIHNVIDLLKPGGILFFRDYGFGDLAQKRFKDVNVLDKGNYARTDGTMSYFFSIDRMHQLFQNLPVEILDLKFVEKLVVNRKEEKEMDRKWLQCRVRKV
jgi:methyltransferase-like protein 6